MRIVFISCLSISFIFNSCHKDSSPICPSQKFYVVPNFPKQFNFKVNGTWAFKNINSGIIDTLLIYGSSGLQTYVPYSPHEQCLQDAHESFNMNISHNMFPGGVNYINCCGTHDGLTVVDSSFSYIGIFQNNIGDSILYKNSTRWNKLESFYASLIVNGTTYNNIYQMSYYPHLSGFRRIWWSPTIGFIKFEFTNKVTHLTEIWELNSYTVQLN